LGKQERVFTIDGEYLHMDTVEKSILCRNKALASYPITDLVACVYSKKNPTNVKITLRKAGDAKVYDLETESKKAYEIAARISYIIEMNSKTT
jgi:sucrose-6-phosphate hydrolase SacC (GH32 family)